MSIKRLIGPIAPPGGTTARGERLATLSSPNQGMRRKQFRENQSPDDAGSIDSTCFETDTEEEWDHVWF